MKILKRTGIKTYLSSAPECPYKGCSRNKPSISQQGIVLSRVVLVILLATASLANGATITVSPGQSIQAAVDGASPGDIIQVRPGIYHEGAPGSLNAVTVTKNDITLVGLSRPGHPVIIENAGGQQFGIWTSPVDSIGPAEEDYEFPPCATSGATVDKM